MATTSKNGSVTNRDLYDSLNDIRKEFSGAIQRLDDKFMQLEAGRLTRAEGAITDLRVSLIEMQKAFDRGIDHLSEKQAVTSNKVVILWAIFTVILSSIATVIVNKVIG